MELNSYLKKPKGDGGEGREGQQNNILFSFLLNLSFLCASRAVLPSSAAGLGPAWSRSGDVRQQPPERPDHLWGPNPPELLVGPQRLRGHTFRDSFCTYNAAKQVGTSFTLVRLRVKVKAFAIEMFFHLHLKQIICCDVFCPRGAIAAGLYGYNGILVGLLMAVFSNAGNWYWWLLLPNIFMSMMW